MTIRLMCLPYAGAGAGVFRPWLHRDSAVLRAVPIQVPGREEEFTEPFYATMAEAAAGTAERIRAAAGTEPFVVFGHSFGATLAYEATHHLMATGGPVPDHLVVSGAVSPRHRQAEALDGDDEEVAAQAAAIAGRPIAAFADPALRAILLPAMRADVNLLAGYAPSTLSPLPMPLTAVRGEADHLAPAAEWLDWSTFTSGAFRTVQFGGGHMYLTEQWSELWKTLEELV
ncbi:alpha/beta fold hydrolase [Streptomyces sp. NBC_00335]|uniref:thioesterase II family protein n=1 Tax=unclassified Streptomyces TaxID=2593676 RepID=UPI0022533AED|nr:MULTISPECIES: alpha/beta fold hydrolase [unclassified Streptomyces]MCX5403591.1 alpha/beta fold hydrolase [Streptomyces sp. NBC_00086]